MDSPLPSVAYQGAVLFGYPTEGRGALSTNEFNPTIRPQFLQSWDNTDESRPVFLLNLPFKVAAGFLF